MFITENGTKREVKSLYPNIAAFYAYGHMSKETLCDHMRITNDIFDKMLYDNEPLSLGERYGFYKLSRMNSSAIEHTRIIYLDPKRGKHIRIVKELEDDITYIWDCAKAGEKTAIDCLDRDIDTSLTEFIERFLAGTGTYAEYINLKNDISFYVGWINHIKSMSSIRSISQKVQP